MQAMHVPRCFEGGCILDILLIHMLLIHTLLNVCSMWHVFYAWYILNPPVVFVPSITEATFVVLLGDEECCHDHIQCKHIHPVIAPHVGRFSLLLMLLTLSIHFHHKYMMYEVCGVLMEKKLINGGLLLFFMHK